MNFSRFQKPSRYIDSEFNARKKQGPFDIRIALTFPDTYEVGMSHLGLRILYHIINNLPFATAERAFAPWTDLRDHLKKNGIPLCSLETRRPLGEFDIIETHHGNIARHLHSMLSKSAHRADGLDIARNKNSSRQG